MIVGSLFKLIRTSRNVSQQKMAESLGISQNYLSLIENGKKQPSAELVKEFSHVVNISREAIILAASEIPKELSAEDQEKYKKLQTNIMSLILFGDAA